MSGQTKPMAQSIALHAAIILLAVALSGLVKPDSSPVVIDFSLEEACAPAVEQQAPQPAAAEKNEVRPEATEHTPPPDNPKPPAPAREADLDKQTPPIPDPEAVPVPAAIPAPPGRLVAPVRTRVVASHPERSGGGQAGTVATPASGGQSANTGGAAASDKAREGYLKANFAYIRDLIHKSITYPTLARKMGWEGKVMVSFVVSRDGRVHDVKVVQSSGRDALDRNAAETVEKTSPFPAPPVEAEVVLPIVYRLN